jgi:hypothetical protein
MKSNPARKGSDEMTNIEQVIFAAAFAASSVRYETSDEDCAVNAAAAVMQWRGCSALDINDNTNHTGYEVDQLRAIFEEAKR